jgi:hypothetical protein
MKMQPRDLRAIAEEIVARRHGRPFQEAIPSRWLSNLGWRGKYINEPAIRERIRLTWR